MSSHHSPSAGIPGATSTGAEDTGGGVSEEDLLDRIADLEEDLALSRGALHRVAYEARSLVEAKMLARAGLPETWLENSSEGVS